MISDADKAMLRKLLEARQSFEEKDEAAKAAKKERDEVEMEVFDRFEDSGVTGTIKVDLGEPWGEVSFRTRETYYAQIVDAELVQEHYEQRAMMDEVSAPKFVMARLNEDVREAMETGGGKMPPGLSYYAKRGMTVTRQK